MPHYCQTCPKKFRSQHAAEQHMDAKDHWGWTCETCDAYFSSQNDVEDHMTATSHWAPNSCETCDRDDFQHEHSVVQHMISQGHRDWESSLADEMVALGSGHYIFRGIEEIFNAKWHHKHKDSDIQSIYFNRRYAYLFEQMPSGWRRYFHGTRRACHVGDSGPYLQLCNRRVCSLCRILMDGFKMNTAGSRGYAPMFGGGINSTSVSSKADNYAMNHHIKSKLHGIILCLVFIGTYEKLHEAEHWRTAPAEGCHSVMGATQDEGGALQYTEAVVYNEASIIPIGLIMYTRTGS